MKIDLIEGVTIARTVEGIIEQFGFHCALGGSILHHGVSQKDCDLFVYPHQVHRGSHDRFAALSALEKAGFRDQSPVNPDYNDKDVVKSTFKGMRVEFFFL